MDFKKQQEQLLDSWLALTGNGPPQSTPITLPVLSGSMLPEIPVQSVIYIEKTEANHCQPGDVVVYRDGDRLVAHRLLWRLGRGSSMLIFEKGDTNHRGSWIRGHQIVGLVLAVDLKDGQPPKPLNGHSRDALAGLKADFRHRLLAFPRRVKGWLFPSSQS